jgi:hypothetical protein
MLFQAKIVPFILNCTLPWLVTLFNLQLTHCFSASLLINRTEPDEYSCNYLISIVGQDGNFDLELLKACFGEPRTMKDIKKVSPFLLEQNNS